MWCRKTHWEPKCKGTDSTFCSGEGGWQGERALNYFASTCFGLDFDTPTRCFVFPPESYSLLAFSCILDTQANCPGEGNIPRINSSIGSQEPRCSCTRKTYMRLVSMYRNLRVSYPGWKPTMSASWRHYVLACLEQGKASLGLACPGGSQGSRAVEATRNRHWERGPDPCCIGMPLPTTPHTVFGSKSPPWPSAQALAAPGVGV